MLYDSYMIRVFDGIVGQPSGAGKVIRLHPMIASKLPEKSRPNNILRSTHATTHSFGSEALLMGELNKTIANS